MRTVFSHQRTGREPRRTGSYLTGADGNQQEVFGYRGLRRGAKENLRDRKRTQWRGREPERARENLLLLIVGNQSCGIGEYQNQLEPSGRSRWGTRRTLENKMRTVWNQLELANSENQSDPTDRLRFCVKTGRRIEIGIFLE